jgi:hypothetical protein
MTFPDTLPLRCPDCGRKLPSAPLMKAATLVLKRSCRCKARFRLKITPSLILQGTGIASTLEWTRR